MANTEKYRVGYCKPSPDAQFKSGQSGNPKGRPKGCKNTMTLLQDILDGKITIVENGKKMKLSRRSVILRQVINAALKGDLKALSMILPLMINDDISREEREKIIKSFHTDDEKIVKAFVENLEGEKRERRKV